METNFRQNSNSVWWSRNSDSIKSSVVSSWCKNVSKGQNAKQMKNETQMVKETL